MKQAKGINERMRIKRIEADCAVLGILAIVICLVLCGTGKVFGADGDWMSQHSVIPDYFRQQFYETGSLFPEFAANIGGGQNIYHFSYYGLYSPVILVSYLLPFVKMGDYLMGASVLGLAAAVMLFYCWLRSRGFSGAVSFGTALIFLLAGPMIYHSYSQVMFVNYMPFLCMGLWGVDRYFERGKTMLFTLSVFLMIMTSYYFSICGMLVLVLYGLHRYFQVKYVQGESVTAGAFLTAGIGFGVRLAAAVMMSGILLVPTALALSGRSGVTKEFSLTELLWPEVNVFRFVYTPYGIGLTTLGITVLITGLTYRKFYEKVLTYGCALVLAVPVFSWLLNGGLYIRDKALIPFLPLLCYLIADYLEKLKKREVSFLNGFLPYLVTLGILYAGRGRGSYAEYWKLVMLDGIVMAACFLILYRKKNIAGLIVVPAVFLAVFTGVYQSSADGMAEKAFYDKVTDGEIGAAIEKVLEEEDGFYRTEQMGTGKENEANMNRIWNMGQYVSSVYSSSYNEDYQEFRNSVFEAEEPFRNFLMQSVSRNPLFQRFMGVKYLVLHGEQEDASAGTGENTGTDTESEIPGYELYETAGDVKVYRNEDVSPIAYGTDRVMTEEEYETLEFPYDQIALVEYAVVENEDNGEPETRIMNAGKAALGNTKDGNADREKEIQKDWKVIPAELAIPQLEENDCSLKKTDNGYIVQTKEKQIISARIEAGEEIKQPILFLQFRVRNHKASKDVSVWVEEEKNTLSAKNHIYYNGNKTFTYGIALQEGQRDVEITFGKGDYEITDIRCWLGCEERKNRSLYQYEFLPDQEQTGGNRITGSIEVENDGYFITTILYDTGFEVLVDGQKTDYEKVNTAFLGFKIPQGSHQVEIVYHAPGAAAGKGISMMGAVIFFCFALVDRKRPGKSSDF
ncbi:MAG: YfhO family protein [Eubacteriales bacterium]|nr:YfhO family protein [Eubacteriales bacterium]